MKLNFVFITLACLACNTPHATSSVVRIAEAAAKTAKEVTTIGSDSTIEGIDTALDTTKTVVNAVADKNKGTGSVGEVVGSAVQGAVSIKQNLLTKILSIGKSILGGAIKIGAAIISNKLALMSATSPSSKPCGGASTSAPAKPPQPPAPPTPPACPIPPSPPTSLPQIPQIPQQLTLPQNPVCNPPPKPACPGSKPTKSADNDIGGDDDIRYILPINPYSTEEVYETVQYY